MSLVDQNKRTDENSPQFCCSCNASSSRWKRRAVNYSVTATAVPIINVRYRTETLTRLGTDLKFDAHRHCPSKSVMRRPRLSEHTPLHDDCPNVFIAGARKAGTTSLYHYLSNHPHFEGTRLDFGPKSGETFHFSSHYETESWSNYMKRFPSGGMMTGDASVGNFVQCKVPERIFKSCGKQSKIIILLRHPIKRFMSNFLMRARLGTAQVQNTTSLSVFARTHLSAFYAEVLERRLDITALPHHWDRLLCLFDPARNLVYEGLYYIHVMNWLCSFPSENILLINSEEFYSNTSVIYSQVLQFLGLEMLATDTLGWITSIAYNRGQHRLLEHQKLSLQQQNELNQLYTPFNEELFQLMDWQNVDWT